VTTAAKKKNTHHARFNDVMSILEAMNYNPIESLVKAAQNEELDWPVRMKAMCIVADKSVPSLKAIEHKTDESQHYDMMSKLTANMLELEDKYRSEY
jgi:hypothetical protein